MRTILGYLLLSLVAAQVPSEEGSHPPIPKKPFELTTSDLPSTYHYYTSGTVTVDFIVNKNGDVEDAVVIDTFDISYNAVILDKVKGTKYIPAHQNGIPVRVRYRLPIAFGR
tara:strand:+ start:2066 stop:2401 length:336 start_codon:yes stop_codon:yes gene_type:complete